VCILLIKKLFETIVPGFWIFKMIPAASLYLVGMMKEMKSLSQSSDSGISTTVDGDPAGISSASSVVSSDSLPDPETQVIYDQGSKIPEVDIDLAGKISPASASTSSGVTGTGSEMSSDPELGSGSGSKGTGGGSSKRRKKERYEICIGYPCFQLAVNESKTVFVYTLQKNQDMMEDLLGHSKLKSSKSFYLHLPFACRNA